MRAGFTERQIIAVLREHEGWGRRRLTWPGKIATLYQLEAQIRRHRRIRAKMAAAADV